MRRGMINLDNFTISLSLKLNEKLYRLLIMGRRERNWISEPTKVPAAILFIPQEERKERTKKKVTQLLSHWKNGALTNRWCA